MLEATSQDLEVDEGTETLILGLGWNRVDDMFKTLHQNFENVTSELWKRYTLYTLYPEIVISSLREIRFS